MSHPSRVFRLWPRGGPGPSCDIDGIALGPIALVTVRGGATIRCEVASDELVRKALVVAYGAEGGVTHQQLLRGLKRAARRFEEGDFAGAAAEAVMLCLPELPLGKLKELDLLLKGGGSAWEDEPRVPAGESGGGEWTAGGNAGAPSAESTPASANPESFKPTSPSSPRDALSPTEIANRDYHDEVVAKAARILRAMGCRVITEIPLVAVDGVAARADILMVTPAGQWNLIEVKTGVGPKYEDSQRLVYPMAMIGDHVFSPDPRIVELGYEPMQPLPAMNFYVAYKRDRKSRLQWVNPKIMGFP